MTGNRVFHASVLTPEEGETISRLMSGKGLTQRYTATELGVSQTTMSGYLRRMRPLAYELAGRLYSLLGETPEAAFLKRAPTEKISLRGVIGRYGDARHAAANRLPAQPGSADGLLEELGREYFGRLIGVLAGLDERGKLPMITDMHELLRKYGGGD